jgi:hypothetical protein
MKFSSIPTYELNLPSNNKKIKYRPFLVKEEKVLLLAMQENKEDHIVSTLKEIINACTFNNLDVDKLPAVDVEYLFIMLRNKSMGDGLDLEVFCKTCEKKNVVTCNMETITVEQPKVIDKNIVLSDELKVTMQYPTLEMSYNLSEDDLTKTIEIISKCIEFIEYQGKLHDTTELPFSEVVEFVEHMTQSQLNKIDEFLESMPQVVFKDKFACKFCGAENVIRIEGISNFFG